MKIIEVIVGSVIILLTMLFGIPLYFRGLDQLQNPPTSEVAIVSALFFLFTSIGAILGLGIGIWFINKPRETFY